MWRTSTPTSRRQAEFPARSTCCSLMVCTNATNGTPIITLTNSAAPEGEVWWLWTGSWGLLSQIDADELLSSLRREATRFNWQTGAPASETGTVGDSGRRGQQGPFGLHLPRIQLPRMELPRLQLPRRALRGRVADESLEHTASEEQERTDNS